MGQLRFLYFYDYVNDAEIVELKQLIQLGYSKHQYGKNKPSRKELNEFTHSILKKPKTDTT
jgi:hypothetical protein